MLKIRGIVLAVLVHQALGQFFRTPTEIGGTIPSNGLTLSKGNYTVYLSITVPDNTTLVIQPGVRLLFKKDTGIMAYGQILAIGNSEEEISMEPYIQEKNTTEPQEGSPRNSSLFVTPRGRTSQGAQLFPWNGVTLSHNRAGKVAIHKSSIKYVRIHKPYYGLTIGYHPVDIDHVTVTESKMTGILYSGYAYDEAVLVLKNCIIRNCTSGIHFAYNTIRKVAIDSCIVENNGIGISFSSNVYPRRYISSISVTRCGFIKNRYAIRVQSANHTTISNSTFIGNSVAYNGRATKYVELKNNLMERNGAGYKYPGSLVQIGAADNIKVENNVFINNSGRQTWRHVVHILFYNIARLHTLQVSGNEFRENINYTNQIYLSRTSNCKNACPCTSCVIQENTFQNNLYSGIRSSTEIHLHRYTPELTITRNCFLDIGKPGCSINSQQTPGNVDIDARRNYWATTDLQLIYSRIYCQKQKRPPVVHILPIYTTKTRDEELFLSWESAYVNGNKLAGEIKGLFTLPLGPDGSCMFNMTYNTYVRPNATLIIPAGCIIEFDVNVGLFVQGSIEFQGTKDRPVTLRAIHPRAGRGSWQGIVYLIKPGTNQKRVKLEHIITEKAQTAFKLELQGSDIPVDNKRYSVVDILINNVNISDSLIGFQSEGGLRGTFLIRNAAFKKTYTGINIGRGHFTRIDINSCYFANNSNSIDLRKMDNSSSINIRNCTFTAGNPNRRRSNDCEIRVSAEKSNVSISRNNFYQIKKHVICLSLDHTNGKCDVNDNIFSRNMDGAGILISFTSVRDVEIRGNVFLDNRNDDGTACIVMNPSGAPSDKSLDIHQNYFRLNHGRYIMQLVNHNWPTIQPHVRVQSNRFHDNYASLATVNAAIVSCAINNNNFENPRSKTDVKIGLNRGPSPRQINCMNNYWGTTDINAIQRKIIDRNDFYALNLAKFEPYLNEPNPNALFINDE